MQTRSERLDPESYTLVTRDQEFLIQNTGTKILQVVATDGTVPADDANGINIREGEAITDRHINGDIWVKGDVTAVITDLTGANP